MKELVTRSLSGFIYIAIVLTATFVNYYVFIGVFLVLGIVCIYEFQKLIHLNSFWLYPLFGILIGIFYFLAIPPYLLLGILAITICIQSLLIKDVLTIRIIPMFEKKKYVTSIGYVILSIVFLIQIPQYNTTYEPMIVAGSFVLIWTNDTFAYLVGKRFGKHKLLERISPKKTIEGFLGGFVFALLMACLIALYSDTLTIMQWCIISVIMSIFGTLGDLIQSKFKRQAGVKDSGTIMPGHGGIFDRLDSIIFASPFLYLFLLILTYVS